MAGTKRASTGSTTTTERETKKSKKSLSTSTNTIVSPETVNEVVNGPEKDKSNSKVELPTGESFISSNLPLHFHISHSPPSISSSDTQPEIIAHVSTLPSIFSTGSYGWKGAKKFKVNLEGGEGEGVYVQLSINAVVVGSKPSAKNKRGKKEKVTAAPTKKGRKSKVEDEEEDEEEANGENGDEEEGGEDEE